MGANDPLGFYEAVEGWSLKLLWEGRVLSLPQTLDADSVQPVLDGLADRQGLGKPLLLHCDTKGGNMKAALALREAMLKSAVPVMTVVREACASAGVWLFAAGKWRVMAPRAELGFHRGGFLTKGGVAYSPDLLKFMGERFDTPSSRYFSDYSRIVGGEEARQLRLLEDSAGRRLPEVLFRRESTWTDAKQSLGLGLADAVSATPALHLWWWSR